MQKKIKAKPKTKRSYKKKPQKSFFNISTFLSFLLVVSVIFNIYFYTNNIALKEQNILLTKKINTLQDDKQKLIKHNNEQLAKLFEEKTKALEIEYTSHIDNSVYLKNQAKKKIEKRKEEIFSYEEPKEEIRKIKKKKEKTIISNKPKLAIIIDDISNKHQVDSILGIGYSINMSFLPPNSSRKYSARVAKNLEHYMIHLPLQASNNRFDEKKTLHIHDSLYKIEARIAEVNKLYPKAKFINNHTGSKFTSNKEAMDKLFRVLKQYNYTFIDSKTTSHSVANLVGKRYGVRVLTRNIFLDNKKSSRAIVRQLKKAIKIAKKNGSAIAIGHPYDITIKTLKNAKYLFDDVDVVFVEQL